MEVFSYTKLKESINHLLATQTGLAAQSGRAGILPVAIVYLLAKNKCKIHQDSHLIPSQLEFIQKLHANVAAPMNDTAIYSQGRMLLAGWHGKNTFST